MAAPQRNRKDVFPGGTAWRFLFFTGGLGQSIRFEPNRRPGRQKRRKKMSSVIDGKLERKDMRPAVNERPDAPVWEPELQMIVAYFRSHASRSLPLHAQLHNTVKELIRQGKLVERRQMPPEQALASSLGISLGTVQKSLQSLQSRRMITREHGRGTFVSPRDSLASLRFFRFCDPSINQLLPVYATVLDRRLVASDQRRAGMLGWDGAGCARLTRLVDVDGRFTCHSQLFLPARVFGEIMTMPIADLENINLKHVFLKRFGVDFHLKSHMIRSAAPSSAICKALNINSQPGMQMEIREQSHDGGIEIAQTIFVPPTEFAVSINLEPSF